MVIFVQFDVIFSFICAGGGLGGTRRGGPDVNVRHSGREEHRDRERRRSRSRDRDRSDRDRRRRRSRSRSRGERKRARRSRSRSRERKRSRSRDRKRARRSRSKDRSDRRRDRERDRGGKEQSDEWSKVRIKDEPEDGGEYFRQEEFGNSGFNAHIKTEQDEDHKPFSANGAGY